jgi:hypothetical protein
VGLKQDVCALGVYGLILQAGLGLHQPLLGEASKCTYPFLDHLKSSPQGSTSDFPGTL